MPSPEKTRQQMERLTAELVGLSLCNRQNFPAMRNLGQGCCEVGIGTKGTLSYALKIFLTETSTRNLTVCIPIICGCLTAHSFI